MNVQELEHSIANFRYAGLMGDIEGFTRSFRGAADTAERIRPLADESVEGWKALLRFDLETSNVPAILGDLKLPIASLPEHSYVAATVSQFIDRHARSMVETHDLVLSLGKISRPRIPADLCIGTWFRLLILPEEFSSSRDVWRFTVEAAASEAKRRGQSIFLLPDYAVRMVHPEQKFLSFHSHGADPNLFHFKPSDFPRRVILDRTGYSGWSSLANASLEDLNIPDLTTVGEFFRAHKSEVHEGNISKYAQKSIEDAEKLPENFIFVALQVSNDQTQTLARISMLDMLDIVVRRFEGSGTQVVVKRHPKCQDMAVEKKLQEMASRGKIILTENSIHNIIPLCRGVCTVNSGVGSESILYLKPIYLFGEADYNCVAYRISSYEDFVQATLQKRPRLSPKDMKRFLYYYRNVYQINVDDPDRLRQRIVDVLFPDTKQSESSIWARPKKLISRIYPKIRRASASFDR
jgi:hypothetical protein